MAHLVILHINCLSGISGINNISTVDKPATIAAHYNDLHEYIRQSNLVSKVIISSILPKYKDRLSLGVIKETNDPLKVFCPEKGFTFLNCDELHLNKRDRTVFGKNIRSALYTMFKLAETPSRNQL